MNISILGCGWLGLPLAERLTGQGHTIHGSTTTKEKLSLLKEKSIFPYLIKLEPELSCKDCDAFWDTELLILNIPPGRSKDDVLTYHSKQISSVSKKLHSSSIKKVVFISSTSVYPKLPGIVTEEDAIPGKAGRASGNALLEAEKMLSEIEDISTAVLRFGGLYGYDRHPAKYMAARKNLDNGSAPVNLIHRDDCIGIIEHIIQKPFTKGVFNAVSDGHPPREIYYKEAARKLGLEPPTFKQDKPKNYKVVSNKKLARGLQYTFRHPNPAHIENGFS